MDRSDYAQDWDEIILQIRNSLKYVLYIRDAATSRLIPITVNHRVYDRVWNSVTRTLLGAIDECTWDRDN